MTDATQPPVLARIDASPARRMFAVAVIGALGLLLMWIAVTQSGGIGWRAVLAMIGGGALWSAARVWDATSRGLLLTRDGMADTDGCLIAPLTEIISVDRGMFAFKPSNGFMLKLAQAGDRGWAPGLWWRVGRRVGVGGVTSAGEAKAMAEILTAMIAQRDGTL